MLMEKVPMTAPGLKSLEDELKQLKSVERPSIIKAIAAAREHGDIRRTPNTPPRANARASSKAVSPRSRTSSRAPK
nr:transcription elongation factor GreA [uncultured bacterium]